MSENLSEKRRQILDSKRTHLGVTLQVSIFTSFLIYPDDLFVEELTSENKEQIPILLMPKKDDPSELFTKFISKQSLMESFMQSRNLEDRKKTWEGLVDKLVFVRQTMLMKQYLTTALMHHAMMTEEVNSDLNLYRVDDFHRRSATTLVSDRLLPIEDREAYILAMSCIDERVRKTVSNIIRYRIAYDINTTHDSNQINWEFYDPENRNQRPVTRPLLETSRK